MGTLPETSEVQESFRNLGSIGITFGSLRNSKRLLGRHFDRIAAGFLVVLFEILYGAS